MLANVQIYLLIGLTLIIFLRFSFYTLGKQNISKNLLQFTYTHPVYAERFPIILRSFLSGSNAALSFILNMNRLRKYLENTFPSYYKGFAYEGVGMGFGIRASLSINNGKTFERYIKKLSPLHKYQYYVGLGWWLLIRYGYREDRYARWLRRVNPKYSLIALDGVGFRTGLFSPKDEFNSFNKFHHFKSKHQKVCFQGYGRSIWFRSEFRFEESMKELEYVPEEYKGDTLSGLGLAVAYSFFDQLDVSFNIYKSIPNSYKPSFAQGMAFGLEARRLQDPSYWKRTIRDLPELNSKYIQPWISIVHNVENRLSSHKESDTFYLSWMNEVRKEILSKGDLYEISIK
ncbi:DUF1702 family protein [Cytobacillus firmus]|uniref:DUF1702 family protein n=1 Tax=Cytobacillus firmus TaxID=1399 RepID=UPI0030026E7C